MSKQNNGSTDIKELLRFKNRTEGQRTIITAVAMIFVLGSYYYTHNSINQMFKMYQSISEKLEEINERDNRIESLVSRIDERSKLNQHKIVVLEKDEFERLTLKRGM